MGDLPHPLPLRFRFALCLSAGLLGAGAGLSGSARGQEPTGIRPWASFVEPGFPFYSSELDVRKAGAFSAADNLTPRGLILPLGHGIQACFDLDLLRVSAVWTGEGVTPVSMAQISYQKWDDKSDVGEGDKALPRPIGHVWLANGIYPGWQLGPKPIPGDPRAPAPSPEEVGRGPVDPSLGRFRGLRVTKGGVCLEYSVGPAAVRERMTAVRQSGKPVLVRWFDIDPSPVASTLILSRQPADANSPDHVAVAVAADGNENLVHAGETTDLIYLTVEAHAAPLKFKVGLTSGSRPPLIDELALPPGVDASPAALWPQTLSTQGTLAPNHGAYVVDDIPVPADNPWHRNVRTADLQFFRDGTAATVTIDGDVWLIKGLAGDLRHVTWHRFASGLHEPLALQIRNDEIFVFDRGGIWRLRDTTGRGEADRYELFSNVFAQSADTREYPSSMKLAPDGAFILSKGGLAATYIGKLNGTVIRVAPDGKSYSVLGWGFRQPFIGVNPDTGLVTASDQEGRYVPSTPLYIVEGNRYHGFLSPFQPHEQYPAPIADPLTWIPHTVLSSALTQVWLNDPRIGPLAGSLVLLGYSRGEIFRVLINRRESRPQAAVVSITHDFRFSPLSAAMNPADGQLYLAGFRGMDSPAERLAALGRVRFTGAKNFLPSEVAPMDRGILVRFDEPVSPATATMLSNYQVETWDYRRRYTYGSFHYKRDGAVGQDVLPVTSAYLSSDGKSVFLGVPGMPTDVMQMHVGWSLAARTGEPMKNDAYLTPYVLTRFDPVKEGFGAIEVDLHLSQAGNQTAAPTSAAAGTAALAAEGARLSQALGCVACHSTDSSRRLGPSWKGIFGQSVTFKDGTVQTVNEAYIRAHLEPHPDRILPGYEAAMPNYHGLINDAQSKALVAYIASLR
jgi:cytochrome c2